MNDNLENKVVILPPFKRFCMTIGEIPTSYLESMTYYEMLLWFTNYLQNTVIPAINNNGEAVTELQEKYIELKNYVDNYFDNLDIQTEIDNKLDEMAESGQLADIIAQYLEVNSVLGFDTKASLKAAENLVNGSIVRTLGTNTYNDGKGNFYKIRTVTTGDVIDDDNILALSEYPTLIAEKMPDYRMDRVESNLSIINEDPINVKLYGVKGDGTTDDTLAIQNCINNNPLKTLYFPKGNYKITSPIYITQTNSKFVNLKLDKYARIFTNAEINSILEIGFDKTNGEYDRYSNYGFITIEGGIFDSANTLKCINLNSSCQLIRLINCNIINIKNYGLYLTKDNVSGSTSGDVKVINCYFDGEGSNTNDTSTAIYIESYDNEFMNIRIDRCKVGIDCESSGNDFFDIHATMLLHSISGDSYTTEQYNSTIGFISRGYNRFNNCYADSFGKGFLIKETNPYGTALINNCYTYHWGGTADTETYSVYFDNCPPKACITNCNFKTPNLGTNHIIYCSEGSYTNNINKEDYLQCVNNVIDPTNTTVPITDLIYNLQLNKINGCSMYGKNVSLNSNTLYPLCVLKASSSLYKLNISNDVQLDIDVLVKFVSNADANIEILNVNKQGNKTYRLALLNVFTENNNTYAYLGLMTRNGESITNALNISNINKCGNNSTYWHIDMNNSATSISGDSIATLPF